MKDDAVPSAGASSTDWLDWTTRQQARASDPLRSAWVSANAGSGKTHVLTQRVVRLLLSGCRPSAILCLTYTKAAASEMSNRVFERLAEWTTLPDSELKKRIAVIEGEQPDGAKLREARRLFARALETPGGLKIQTIHAFCEALLHQFPLEANLAGHFSVLDDRATAALLADARRLLLTATTGEDDRDLAAAFATVLELADDTGLEKLITTIIANRSSIRLFLSSAETADGIDPVLRAALSLDPHETEQSALERFWPLPGLSGHDLDRYLDLASRHGGAKVQEFAAGVRALAFVKDPVERSDGLVELFFTQSGKPRAESAFNSKQMLANDPSLRSLVQSSLDHVIDCRDRLNRVRMLQATLAALVLADRLDKDYEDLKKRRSQLDFDDLINRTAALLSRGDVSAWIHYKLDQGIDHILVDEAQDTSPKQWQIIRSLTEDFFSGETARSVNRSVFAVGDEKQSIYSFQGARPERFSEERTATAKRIADGGKPFSPVELQLSFRSTDDVLSSVDAVFAHPDNAKGLSAASTPVIHASNRIGEAGAVDVWEVIKAEPGPPDGDWTAAFDSTPESAPVNVLAKRIAATLESWIGQDSIIEKGRKRLIEPGDVIVLVRKRDAFVNALTRALKVRKNIPVAGADRLVLTKHIAIQDLLALGRFVLLPEDDLSLSALLKSPLFNFSEDQVFAIAGERGEEESVWTALQRRGADGYSPESAAILSLRMHIAAASQMSAHDFYARVIGKSGGRRAFLARLGSEVSDILDEFLTFALDYETAGLPGLQAFVSGLETEAPTVKREQDKERNEVRIMTVHAAKGLEAPIVFLVDGGGKPFSAQHLPSLRLLGDPADVQIPVWLPPKSPSNTTTARHTQMIKDATEEEYRRLLYVGMTRAADRLIVCGYSGARQNSGTWHEMISQSLGFDERGQVADFSAGGETWTGLSWRSSQNVRNIEPWLATERRDRRLSPLPPGLSAPLPAARHLPRPLSPSGAGAVIDEQPNNLMVGSPLFADGEPENLSLRSGAILHRLLQVLPSIESTERPAAAERYVNRSVPAWPQDKKDWLATSALALLNHEDLAPVFSGHSEAEVAIMGTLKLDQREFAVSGRIDRLAIVGDTVWIVDFKTNRAVPRSEDDVAFEHKAQLAIYRAILQPLYPDQEIACSLVYTEGPAIIRLSPEMLETSLAQLSTK